LCDRLLGGSRVPDLLREGPATLDEVVIDLLGRIAVRDLAHVRQLLDCEVADADDRVEDLFSSCHVFHLLYLR
jgi:hypothetical protein